MAGIREQIAEILVDCKDEEEQMMSWESAFMDDVNVPFEATLLNMPVEVHAFRVNNANALQCQILREKKQRWVGVENLDEESLSEDCLRVFKLYSAWVEGDY